MINVYILNSKIKNRDYNGIVLDENDFHPCIPFFLKHPEISPESVDKIYIRGILENYKYFHAVLKYCDYILKDGGIIEIDYFNISDGGNGFAIRSRKSWWYVLSLMFGERIHLIKAEGGLNGHYVYKKVGRCLPENDSIEKWSFGIVSDGRKNERILSIIDRIYSFNIPYVEIIICGPSPSDRLPKEVKVIDDSFLYIDKRIPISKKKNLIIEHASYNNLIIIHDRINFPEDWYLKMCEYGNYYDCLDSPILNEEDESKHMSNWCVYPQNAMWPTLFNAIFRSKFKLDYSKWSPDIFINGGFIQMKRHLIKRILLNPYLNWADNEDVDLYSRAYLDGVLIEFNPYNKMFSAPVRFAGEIEQVSTLTEIRTIFRAVKLFYTNLLGFYKYLKDK